MLKHFFQAMRRSLKPQGSKPVVRLRLKDASYFDADFVQKAIDEYEKKLTVFASGLDNMTALETIAFEVLKDSSYLSRDDIEELMEMEDA